MYDSREPLYTDRIMRIFRYPALVGIIVVLAACATPMRAPAIPHINAQVTTFHQLPAIIVGMKFAVMPVGEQATSLEFATYSTQVRLGVTNAGLIETDVSEADITVAFAYTIDSSKQFTIDEPTYGQTGISGAATTGTVNDAGRYTATTTYTPTYGITGYRSSPIRMYTRQMIIRIADNKKSGNGTGIYM